jgi:hypothetical protein
VSEPHTPVWMHSEANARYLLRRGVSVEEVQQITALPLATVELIARQIAGEPARKLLIERRRTIKRIAAGLPPEEVAARTTLPPEEVSLLKKRLEGARAMLAEGKKREFVSRSFKIRIGTILVIAKELGPSRISAHLCDR